MKYLIWHYSNLCGDTVNQGVGFNLFCMNQSSHFSMYFIIMKEVTHNNHLEGGSISGPGYGPAYTIAIVTFFIFTRVQHKAETAYMLVNIPGCYVCMVNDSYTNTSVCTYLDVNFFHISTYN